MDAQQMLVAAGGEDATIQSSRWGHSQFALYMRNPLKFVKLAARVTAASLEAFHQYRILFPHVSSFFRLQHLP